MQSGKIKSINIPDESINNISPMLACSNYASIMTCLKFQEDDSNHGKKSRSWYPIEDQRLLQAISIFGVDNWSSVARVMGTNRTRSQCAQRWIRCLNPVIKRDGWSEEEDKKLMDIVSKFGEKRWMRISSEMGNRSDVQCRHRYFSIKKSMEENIQKSPKFKFPSIKEIVKEENIENFPF